MSAKHGPFNVSSPGILAVTFGLVIVCSILNAGDSTPAGQSPPGAFGLSPNSVLNGDRLIIGDVHQIPATAAEALAAVAFTDEETWRRCIQSGPTWLRESEDGTKFELQWPWGARDKHRLLTAQCEDGTITIGGYALTGPEDNPEKRAMLFLYDPSQDGPVTITIEKQLTVGFEKLTLTEVRAVDPVSRRIVFSATAESGTELYVTAPYRLANSPVSMVGISLEERANAGSTSATSGSG